MAEDHRLQERSAPEDWKQEPSALHHSAEGDDPADGTGLASAGDSTYAPDPIDNSTQIPASSDDTPLFQNYEAPPPQDRIPNFGHLLLLGAIVLVGILMAGLLIGWGLRLHLWGITEKQKALTDIHYTLGSEAVLYLFTLLISIYVFPILWQKSFLAGLHWNVATAIRLRYRLVSAAFACLILAAVSSLLVPGPTNAPIDKIFRAPGAAWLLFAFGVTFAPFFEEMFFRGFLLPALCTSVDWFGEKIAHQPRRPLDSSGHPQWSISAIIVGSLATSIPFAAMHAEQTGYALGPFVLLCGVSLVLCAIRLSTRSLASSVFVHACYNFVLFSIMLASTEGFQHLDKM